VLNRLRDPFSGLTHLAAAVASAFGLAVLLVVARGAGESQVSILVYGCTLVLMFSSSAAYHLVKSSPKVETILRKLDHTAIYLLIAGTYTPICLHFFSGFWRRGVLAVIWSMAVIGIAVTAFLINAPRGLTAGVYVMMGWLSLMAIKEMLVAMPVGALVWLLMGGLCFTAGAVVYATRRPDFFPGVFGFHELWHVFVILGCLCHFVLVAAYVAPQASAV
jgi:hemolysin III